MSPFSASDVMQLGYYLLAAGAVYGGIRADLKGMHSRIEHAQETAKEAHRRIDGIVERRTK